VDPVAEVRRAAGRAGVSGGEGIAPARGAQVAALAGAVAAARAAPAPGADPVGAVVVADARGAQPPARVLGADAAPAPEALLAGRSRVAGELQVGDGGVRDAPAQGGQRAGEGGPEHTHAPERTARRGDRRSG